MNDTSVTMQYCIPAYVSQSIANDTEVPQPEPEVSIYPNPAGKVFFVELNMESPVTSIEIVNMKGEVVYSNKYGAEKASRFKIAMDKEVYGMHVLRLSTAEGISVNRKVIFVE